MMWVRAVWKEPNGEEEGVIPEVWVKDNMVHWPPGANVTKAAKEMRTPTSSWKMFPLLKIKFKSNNQEECEAFDQTSTAEISEEECGPVKRVSKKKIYPGFILDEDEHESRTKRIGLSFPKPPRIQEMSSQALGSEENDYKSRSRSPFHDSLLQSSRSLSQWSHTPSHSTVRQQSHTPHHSTSHERSHTLRHTTSRHRSQSPTHSTPRQRSRTPHHTTSCHQYQSPTHSTPRQRSRTPHHTTSCHQYQSPTHSTPRQRSRTPRHRSKSPTRSTPRQWSRTPRHSYSRPRDSSPHQRSSSSYECSQRPARENQHREGGELFPLDNGKFQRRVLYLLSDIRAKLSEVGQNREPPESQFHLEKMNSRRELKNLEGQLAVEEKRNVMVSRLVRIGGADLEDCVKNMMKRVLTNRLMATMNMDGSGVKKAFGKTRLCRVMIGAVQQSKPSASEAEIKKYMGSYLRSAPDRYGGMGRQKGKSAIEVCSDSE
ncbi:serine/arginine repetitive matrix protein 5-like isoform X2 [Carassius auratus]|uniref:Serine/arginine repetitive matrix protein 5-like isoform X2 n=1 Tax=Carassius auratus TaxID=7957 RepID=A0A6P6MGC1_CARAU|nr:serine/arginine repetitive matrix protein 5-like isoform X2 [Carassius auratus]XP_026095544.1 serine/arginine repetitive matrix protein 5-like isoform X2 [Carassius auratus]